MAARAAARLSNLHRNSRWLKGRMLKSLSSVRTSAVEVYRKVFLVCFSCLLLVLLSPGVWSMATMRGSLGHPSPPRPEILEMGSTTVRTFSQEGKKDNARGVNARWTLAVLCLVCNLLIYCQLFLRAQIASIGDLLSPNGRLSISLRILAAVCYSAKN